MARSAAPLAALHFRMSTPDPSGAPIPESPSAPVDRALTTAGVRKIATLARLEITDEQAEAYREQLGAVLGYMNRLRELDLAGVEPLTHPMDATNRLDDDQPGPTLSTEQFMEQAPATMPPFLVVPKVLGGDGGA